MSFLQIVLTLVVVAALSAGQVLFKMAAMDIFRDGGFRPSNLVSGKLAVALVVYGFATALWLALLRITPLRLAYPFVALAFMVVPVLSYVWLGEPLRVSTFVGAAIILAGVWVSVGWG